MSKNHLSIELDSVTENIHMDLQGFSVDDDSYLLTLNRKVNSLDVYRLDSGRLLRSIQLAQTGPEGVGSIGQFYFHSFDSIFIATMGDPEIDLIDTSGQILDRIYYETPAELSTANIAGFYFPATPLLKNGSLYTKARPVGNNREMTNAKLGSTSLGYRLDLADGDVERFKINYPEHYLQDGLKAFDYSMTAGAGKVVFSFFGDHNLYWSSDPMDGDLKAVNAKSRFLPQDLPLFPQDGDRDATYEYLYTSDRYEGILYDRFRKLFYRIAIPAVDAGEYQDELRTLAGTPVQASIMVFDEDLNLIGEFLTEKKRYVYNNMFVTREGLWISACHPFNEENEEDVMKFDLLTLQF
jgi:hypothetical protein